MNDEPGNVNVVGADKTVEVATPSPRNSNRTRRSSRKAASEPSTTSTSASTSASTNQTMDGSTEEGEKRNTNTNTKRSSRNHSTRSRTPRSSPPHKTKSEGQSKSVGFFHLHCIDAHDACYRLLCMLMFVCMHCTQINKFLLDPKTIYLFHESRMFLLKNRET